MIRNVIAATIVASLGAVGTAQASGNAGAGATKASACFACHGEKGPRRSGPDLVKMLKDFKSGAETNPVMKKMAGGLEEQDMEDLAAYFKSVN